MARKLTKDQRDALELVRGFREREPSRALKVDIQLPKAAMIMGHLEAVLYRTTHGRRSVLYKHEFAPGSRPLLCAGTKRGQLYIIGEAFHVTERGIVDLDSDGEEIDDESERYD